MTGIAQILNTTFTDTTLPVIDLNDKILVTGSLLLLDLVHSSNPLPAGVPITGATIPNIAWLRAKAMIGSGDANSLGAIFENKALSVDALFERTGKGGLHGIYSQVNNVNNRGAVFKASPIIRDYIYTNRAHHFYFSKWSWITRIANVASGNQPRTSAIFSQSAGGNRMVSFDPTGTLGNASTGFRASAGVNVVGNQIRSVDATGFASDPASNTDVLAAMQLWGNYPPGDTVWTNISASEIFYRSYMEDLTVSGRTYAQVDALDFALWNADFSAGGRYVGDTFTAAASFP